MCRGTKIAVGDQHLIDDAPAYALHRLRKAELTRLWKVAGMWLGDDGDAEINMHQDEEDEDQGMSKRELVDGLIAAVCPTFLVLSVSHLTPLA